MPFLDTIYIDKPVQRHNLIQTISRVNRKFENRCNVWQVPDRIQFKKGLGVSALRAVGRRDAALFPDSCVPPRSLSLHNSTRRALDSGKITRGLRPATSRTMHAKKGLVVDYIGIKKQMNLALAHYSNADSGNLEEIEASIIVVRDNLDLMARIFHQFDTKPCFSGTPVEQLHCLNRAASFGSAVAELRWAILSHRWFSVGRTVPIRSLRALQCYRSRAQMTSAPSDFR